MAHHLLPAVEHGADLGDAHAVQPGHRLETGQAPFKDKGHKESLHRVVIVVPQGDLGDPPLLHGVVQGATAHFGAHGAGVLLLAHIKDNMVDLAGNQGIGNAQLLAVAGHRGKVHTRTAVGVAHI